MLLALVLVGASAVAASTDLAMRRVPNVLTFGLAAVALAVTAMHGIAPFFIALVVYAALLVAGTIPYGAGWFGGGDVKLLAAGAICAGWPGSLTFFVATALAGGVLALAELARARRLALAFSNLTAAALSGTLAHGVTLDPQRRRLPYALAIAAGALVLLASETIAPWLRLPTA